MESVSLGADCDDREEGEIVEDDFEDISDNSIIVPLFGKSVSPKEHLPAISLSSTIDVDKPKSGGKIRNRRKSTKKKGNKTCRKRRNSHRKSVCSDSDSDDLDRKLQEQLKAAVRVDDSEERHKNSLRSRLRAMTKLEDSEEGKNGTDKVECNEKVDQKNSSDEGDSELAQLRLEALRTAVLNKFMHRKKRKVKEIKDTDIMSDVSVKTDTSETNKENNHGTIENCAKKICIENTVHNIEKTIENTNDLQSSTPPEDDEDVLRALLLASMSKKITRESATKKVIAPLTNNGTKQTIQTVSEKKDLNVKMNVNVNSKNYNFRNRVLKNNVLSKNLQLPEIKPLIINVNQDSDSEDDFLKTVKCTNEVAPPKILNTDIESTVEKFLKEQRAKVEAQLSPVPKLSPIPKPVEKLKNPPLILEKSSVKLLSKVKQMEYQKLLQKLNNATERKKRLRKTSHKINERKPVTFSSKKIVRMKITPAVSNNKQVNAVSKVDPQDVKNELRTLHKLLKEIQVPKNGRLQIQEKYKVLTPVIKKINEASVERRKCEEEVNRLLQEVADMKQKLNQCHLDFCKQINNLVLEKQEVDMSISSNKIQSVSARFTSTPIKEKQPVVSFETSSIPTSTPNNTFPLSESNATPTVEIEMEDMVDAPLNPGDPNDIDLIYSKQKSSFPKYISPLDKVKRVVTDDPFSIICPYDVDGNCRDPECIYKHFQVK